MTSFGFALVAARRGRQVGGVIILVVVLVFSLLIVLGGGLAPKLPLDVSNINPDAVGFTVALSSDFPVIQPRLRSKIHRFGAVVAEIVARVIAIGECDDELSFVVDKAVDLDLVLRFEKLRRDEIGLVAEELIAVLCIVWPD